MLVLTCKPGEAVVIGDNIRLTVVAIRGNNKVRLGFTTPVETPIRREELCHVLLGDGSVRFISTFINPNSSWALSTMNRRDLPQEDYYR